MGFGSIVGGLGGMIGTAFGGAQANASAQSAAQNQAYMDDLKTQLNTEIYNDQNARNEPYRQFGVEGVNSLRDGYDFQQTPEYQYRQQLGGESIQGLGGFDQSVLDYAGKRMGAGMDATEEDAAYSKIMDRIMIGQGQAASAGQGAQQYGNALASAYQQTGETNRLANMYGQNSQQNMINTGLEQASNIPAYMKQQNYLQGLNSMPMSQEQGTQNTPAYLMRSGY